MRKTLFALVLGMTVAGHGLADRGGRFDARLEGFNAAGTPVPTNATGTARVEVIDGGTALKFRVNVAGLDNLLMAHIHIAPEPVSLTGPAGPIAFWFVGGPPAGTTVTERINGRLAEGYIVTNGDLVVWDATDPDSGTVKGLIEAIQEGRASVVVHTDDLDPNTPTGVAGDSRAGELRGTLR
jgi:hypothetical protein